MSRYIIDLSELPEMGLELVGAKVAFDVETNGLRWFRHHIIGLGVACPERGVEFYAPAESDRDRERLRAWVRGLPAGRLIAHNIKFEFHMLDIEPATLRAGGYDDTMVMAHLIDSRQLKALGKLEAKYLGTFSKRNHVEKAGGRGVMIWDWPLAAVADYCVNDCLVTRQLYDVFTSQLTTLDLWELYEKEMIMLDVLWRAERRGILINTDLLHRTQLTIDAWKAQAMEEYAAMFRARGLEPPLITSAKQLSKALYEDWPWPKPVNPYVDASGVDRSRKGQIGGGHYNSTMTNTFVLSTKAEHPAAPLISWIREITVLGNVQRSWDEARDSGDRIHTNLNQTQTVTGRLSSSEPALQNIASEIRSRQLTYQMKGMEGENGLIRQDELNLRRLLVATPGYSLVSIDHKQQEIRMFAVLAQEPAMLRAAMTGLDIHKQVAEMTWGNGDKVHREWAKVISFGLIYGMNQGGLEHRLNKPRREANKIAEQYWSAFPRVKPWLREVVTYCRREGWVRYWSGRLWREENPTFMYKAANALIQGGSADLMSIAAIRCDRWLRESGAGHLLNIIHDELLFEIKDEALEDAIPALCQLVEVEDVFNVPFFADPKIGLTYGDMHEPERSMAAD